MNKIIDVIKTIGGILGALVIMGFVLYAANTKSCNSDDEYDTTYEESPRKKVTSDEIIYGDSVYVLSTKLDTVYRFHLRRKKGYENSENVHQPVLLPNDSLPCSHRFDDPNNLKGIKIQLITPCEWPAAHTDTTRNEVLKYFYRADERVISESVVIGGILSDTTDKDIKMLLSNEGLKELTKGAGEYVSVGPLLVNDIKGGQVTMRSVKTNERGTFYFYAIQNYFVCKMRLVLVQYTSISQSEGKAKECLPLFQDLVQRTIFR